LAQKAARLIVENAMSDFAVLRRRMVDGQLRTADVTDQRVLAAMLAVPREHFVPQDKAALAYLDRDVCLDGVGRPGRWLLKPMALARLLQAAQISESDRVLDVGCATGYAAALLARLAHAVVALEEDEALAALAQERLAACGAASVTVVTGALAAGWPAGGPYDAIVLEGACETAPQSLLVQLKEGGRLVCVLGRGPGGKIMLYRLVAGELSGRPIFDASAALLPGFARVPEFVF